jgi:hypothetical protein
MKPQDIKHMKVRTASYSTQELTLNMHKRYGNIHHICNAFYLPHSVFFCMETVNMIAMMI